MTKSDDSLVAPRLCLLFDIFQMLSHILYCFSVSSDWHLIQCADKESNTVTLSLSKYNIFNIYKYKIYDVLVLYTVDFMVWLWLKRVACFGKTITAITVIELKPLNFVFQKVTVQNLYSFHLFQMSLHCWMMISLLTMSFKIPTDPCFISPKHFVFSTISNTAILSDRRVDASEPAAALITWDRICHHITLYFP